MGKALKAQVGAVQSQEGEDALTVEQIIGISAGDRVAHRLSPDIIGTVRSVDWDNDVAIQRGGTTTCTVQWDDLPDGKLDTLWTKNLIKISGDRRA